MMRLNEFMMKAMKAFNFISGSSAEEEDLKKHRESVEKMSRLVTPKDDVNIAHFKVGDIDCEAIRSCENFNPHYAIMYAHGGGYMSGGADYARILGTKLAIATGFTTVTFSYRLSPEHPYPAAIEDGMDVWNYLTRGVVSPTHLYLAGDSAGGNLALCLTQMLLSEGRETPKGLILFSPWTDMTGNAESYETNKDVDPVLSKEFVENAVKVYINGAGTPDEARFSPLFGSFDNFPPTVCFAGKNEILFDDSKRLCDRIKEAGGKAVFDVEEKGWHVYEQLPIPIANQAMRRLSKYIKDEQYGA
ncbi:MAG: alpha/beta hydrolase [Lachnospiraceae bacterium]|nr:alpha/beta hydrolase [Lachnospiraceae bacterium]